MPEVMIKVNPESDEGIIAFKAEVDNLCRRAEAFGVVSDNDVKVATDDLLMIVNLRKAIEGKKKEFTAPISAHLDAVRDAFKPILEPLKEAGSILRGKVLAYDAEQERRRAEKTEINRLRMEAAQKEMGLNGELSESVNEVEVQPAQPKIYRAEAGKSSKVRNMQWKVTDFSLVPDDLKMVDAARIKKIVDAGGSIPGIESWNEPTLRVSGA